MPERDWDTDDNKRLAKSLGYLTASNLTLHSETTRERPNILRTPILYNAGFGIELLLKSLLVRDDASLADVRKTCSHRIDLLWEHLKDEPIRGVVCLEAEMAYKILRQSGRFPDWVDIDPIEHLDQQIRDLAALCVRGDFPLRYIAKAEDRAPRPWLSVATFLRVVEGAVRNSSSLARDPWPR